MASPPPGHARLLHLDVFRGVAAIAVVYAHLAEYVFFPHWSPDWKAVSAEVAPQLNWGHYHLERWVAECFRRWIDFGRVGVIMFFALSGFVIHFSISQRMKRPLATFAVRRFLRVYPIYWTSLLMALGLAFLGWIPLDPATHWGQFLANASLAQEWFGVPNVLGVYWTLEVEVLFYVCCAIMFALGLMQQPAWRLAASIGVLLLTVGVAIGAWTLDRRLPLAPGLSLSIMFWATLWQGWIISGDRQCLQLSKIGFAALLLLIPVITLLGYNPPGEVLTGSEGWNRLATYWIAVWLFVILTLSFRGRSWGPRPLLWLGTISYSVYLLHTLVMYAGEATGVMQWMKQFPPTLYFILVILVSIGLGSLTWFLVERTCTQLGRRLTPWEKKTSSKTSRQASNSST
ncbi:MAG: acyltransferase [Phycisphaerales bacterium]|nr:acyltransferase [Phycisphaerales bacterium]